MDLYSNETVSSPPLPSNKASQEATTSSTIPPNTTLTADQREFKNCHKKWIYASCFIVVSATVVTAIVSLMIALSSNKSKECELVDLWTYLPKNCYQLVNSGVRTSGEYSINVGMKTTKVYCDMETDGGGWTVIQRRVSNETDFYRGWLSYQVGFGNLSGNFWLGLDNIHAITNYGSYQLRVDLQGFSNIQVYGLYNSFSIGSESSNYTLHVSGFSGDATDSLKWHNNQPFTTKDRDNDDDRIGNCAVDRHGAWWYKDCSLSNLNGKYYSSAVYNTVECNSVYWFFWNSYNSLKRVEMKIKPN